MAITSLSTSSLPMTDAGSTTVYVLPLVPLPVLRRSRRASVLSTAACMICQRNSDHERTALPLTATTVSPPRTPAR